MHNKNLSDRKAALEANLSRVAGLPVEITFINGPEISVSAEGNALAALEKVRAYLGGGIRDWSALFDASCDLSCAYATLNGF